MSEPFRAAFSLWVDPYFSDGVVAGKCPPPRVDYSNVNYEALADLLVDLFPYGPPVRIRVPNDAIDALTLQLRNTSEAALRCTDFGETMLRCAKKQQGRVIDVRKEWAPLHAVPDRGYAPPPVVLPLINEAIDFEDAMLWHSSARPSLGLPFLVPFMQDTVGKNQEETHIGKLPEKTRQGLGKIFGTPFLHTVLMDRMAMDTPPKEYGL